MLELKETELYQEIDLLVDNKKIGEAEVNLKDNYLSRLNIFPPYQDKGYGTQIVEMLTKKYDIKELCVKADNERAIHVYEKNGYKITKPTFYSMEIN